MPAIQKYVGLQTVEVSLDGITLKIVDGEALGVTPNLEPLLDILVAKGVLEKDKTGPGKKIPRGGPSLKPGKDQTEWSR